MADNFNIFGEFAQPTQDIASDLSQAFETRRLEQRADQLAADERMRKSADDAFTALQDERNALAEALGKVKNAATAQQIRQRLRIIEGILAQRGLVDPQKLLTMISNFRQDSAQEPIVPRAAQAQLTTGQDPTLTPEDRALLERGIIPDTTSINVVPDAQVQVKAGPSTNQNLLARANQLITQENVRQQQLDEIFGINTDLIDDTTRDAIDKANGLITIMSDLSQSDEQRKAALTELRLLQQTGGLAGALPFIPSIGQFSDLLEITDPTEAAKRLLERTEAELGAEVAEQRRQLVPEQIASERAAILRQTADDDAARTQVLAVSEVTTLQQARDLFDQTGFLPSDGRDDDGKIIDQAQADIYDRLVGELEAGLREGETFEEFQANRRSRARERADIAFRGEQLGLEMDILERDQGQATLARQQNENALLANEIVIDNATLNARIQDEQDNLYHQTLVRQNEQSEWDDASEMRGYEIARAVFTNQSLEAEEAYRAAVRQFDILNQNSNFLADAVSSGQTWIVRQVLLEKENPGMYPQFAQIAADYSVRDLEEMEQIAIDKRALDASQDETTMTANFVANLNGSHDNRERFSREVAQDLIARGVTEWGPDAENIVRGFIGGLQSDPNAAMDARRLIAGDEEAIQQTLGRVRHFLGIESLESPAAKRAAEGFEALRTAPIALNDIETTGIPALESFLDDMSIFDPVQRAGIIQSVVSQWERAATLREQDDLLFDADYENTMASTRQIEASAITSASVGPGADGRVGIILDNEGIDNVRAGLPEAYDQVAQKEKLFGCTLEGFTEGTIASTGDPKTIVQAAQYVPFSQMDPAQAVRCEVLMHDRADLDARMRALQDAEVGLPFAPWLYEDDALARLMGGDPNAPLDPEGVNQAFASAVQEIVASGTTDLNRINTSLVELGFQEQLAEPANRRWLESLLSNLAPGSITPGGLRSTASPAPNGLVISNVPPELQSNMAVLESHAKHTVQQSIDQGGPEARANLVSWIESQLRALNSIPDSSVNEQGARKLASDAMSAVGLNPQNVNDFNVTSAISLLETMLRETQAVNAPSQGGQSTPGGGASGPLDNGAGFTLPANDPAVPIIREIQNLPPPTQAQILKAIGQPNAVQTLQAEPHLLDQWGIPFGPDDIIANLRKIIRFFSVS